MTVALPLLINALTNDFPDTDNLVLSRLQFNTTDLLSLPLTQLINGHINKGYIGEQFFVRLYITSTDEITTCHYADTALTADEISSWAISTLSNKQEETEELLEGFAILLIPSANLSKLKCLMIHK